MTYLELKKYVEQQIWSYLCYKLDSEMYIKEAVTRTRKCIFANKNKYNSGWEEEEVPFSVYHSVHYCIFLYQMSRVAFELDGNGINAEKFYYLNKIMHSVDIFYEVKLPEIWNAEHPLGSVMGRAEFSDYFFFYQGCTVGGNKMCYPKMGSYVIMYSNSKVLGNSKIGDNVTISANTYIKGEDIPNNSVVFGQSPNLIIKRKNEIEIQEIYSHIWKK